MFLTQNALDFHQEFPAFWNLLSLSRFEIFDWCICQEKVTASMKASLISNNTQLRYLKLFQDYPFVSKSPTFFNEASNFSILLIRKVADMTKVLIRVSLGAKNMTKQIRKKFSKTLFVLRKLKKRGVKNALWDANLFEQKQLQKAAASWAIDKS